MSVYRHGCVTRSLHVVAGDPSVEHDALSLELWLKSGVSGKGTYPVHEASYRYYHLSQHYDDLELPSFGWGIGGIGRGRRYEHKKVALRADLRITRTQPLGGTFELVRASTSWKGAFTCS